jgi:hypothetical protein
MPATAEIISTSGKKQMQSNNRNAINNRCANNSRDVCNSRNADNSRDAQKDALLLLLDA